MITRRKFMKTGAALGLTAAVGTTATKALAQGARPTGPGYDDGGMGLASTSMAIRLGSYGHTATSLKDDSIAYLEYCHSIGSIGVQMAVKGDLMKFRKRAEDLGIFVEYQGMLPDGPEGDLAQLEKAMEEAKTVGATTMRVVSTGKRRYESFKTLADFQESHKRHQQVVEKIVPLAEKHKVILAMENHKDRTSEEFAWLLKKMSSEYYGSLLDYGNNLSLSEEPMTVVKNLAPWVKSTHLKDMAVEPYADGFLLSEVVCGQGFLDLKGITDIVRRSNPKCRIFLEMITDHVLKIPINTDEYWATFPERKATALPAIKKLVAEHTSKMPVTQGLTEEQLLAREEDNNKRSLQWARENLALPWLA